MKLLHTIAATAIVSTASALAIVDNVQAVLGLQNEQAAAGEQYLIELAPGKTMMVTDEDKWELKRVCCKLLLFGLR